MPYSAAAASDSFGRTVAADSMKSEIRGTISDLKRELRTAGIEIRP